MPSLNSTDLGTLSSARATEAFGLFRCASGLFYDLLGDSSQRSWREFWCAPGKIHHRSKRPPCDRVSFVLQLFLYLFNLRCGAQVRILIRLNRSGDHHVVCYIQTSYFLPFGLPIFFYSALKTWLQGLKLSELLSRDGFLRSDGVDPPPRDQHWAS